jgi:anaerobic magnesium-protoporphyrin IX monomethyl ester cyclase
MTAVVLASALENASLSWQALDPGHRELDWWREALMRKQASQPRTVAVSTTFVLTFPWLRAFFEIVRRVLPDSKIIVGGAYYSTSAKKFLSLDADVFCIGEGELRFPEIVRAIGADRPLEGIPGLYLFGKNGGLRHTGHAEPINLRARPPVDWCLAERIEPSVNPREELLEVGVETQRGCIFKCEFCTYRTLTSPSALGPKEAADAIMGAATVVGNAAINILDATATFPHERWIAILQELIARGGSPHPIWAFSRVTDINERTASLMAAAGVSHLYVGQESGDQRILDAMKKGTKVAQVRGAVEALAKHGIIATFSFIHGFPKETTESIIATRRMIETLNRGFESNPPVLIYQINPFAIPDFSSVTAREEFKNVANYFDYPQSDFSADRTFAEVLTTIMALSRIPFAPAYAHLFFKSVMPTVGSSVFIRNDKIAFFRWLKAVERGICLFLQRSLEGTPIDDTELRRVRDTILAAYPGRPLRQPPFRRYFGRRLLDRLQREWRAEPSRGPGLVTRAYLGRKVWRQMNDFQMGWHTWRTGEIGGDSVAGHRVPSGDVSTHAAALIARARTTPNKYLKEALPARRGIRS